MKPIFCGNLEYEVRQSDLERLFGRYGNVDRVDIKTGGATRFAFVYMDDERDAKDAISGLDRKEFGRQGRRLRVEWTKEERGMRRPSGRPGHFSGNLKPTKTLFVINFDPISTRTRDLERHFEPYGKISNIRIRRNFAFIQYESLDDANKALEATNMSKILDRVISVEYAVRDDNERRDVHSPDQRDRGRPRERKHDYDRSSSPYRRAERASPDYGHSSRSPRRSDPQGSPDQRVRDRSPPKRQNWDNGRSPSPIKTVQDRSLEMRRKASGRRSPNFYERADPNGDPNLSPYGRRPQQDSSPYDESPISER